MSVLIISIVVIVVAFAVLMVGAFFGISYLTRRKQAADLDRYLKGENCQWERIPTPGEAATDTEGDLLYKNAAPESNGIEMRTYYSRPPAGAEDEGVCLSIIDPRRTNGMILNGFEHVLNAMQFGDGLWNDQFLADTGIMERMITEKRVAWDQLQREIIVGHYSLFM